MADSEKVAERYHYTFIHNVLGNFHRDTMEYLSTYLYPRFEHKIIGTFDKAVEYFNKKQAHGREIDKPNLPAIILNPSGDFGIADKAEQFFRFPNLAPGFINRLYYPIYQDENVIVTVGPTRVEGEMEVIFLLPSFNEYCDLKMFLLQIFGGYERPIYPIWFNSFIILPPELYNYTYVNEVTNQTYKLDWDSVGVSQDLVKSTNQHEYIYPCDIRPWYILKNLSDGSSRYGGSDKLAEWKLTATINYEVELPTYLILQTDYLVNTASFNIVAGSSYSVHEYKPPESFCKKQLNVHHPNLSETESVDYSSGLPDSDPMEITVSCDDRVCYEFNNRYFHVVTQQEVDSTADLEIIIEEHIDVIDQLILNSTYGEMIYGTDYILDSDGFKITIKRDYVTLVVGQIIEIYTYTIVEN